MKTALVVALFVLVAGCGGGSGASTPPVSKSDQCRSLLLPARDAVQEFTSRFESGLSREQFNDRAGDLRVALDHVDDTAPGEIASSCGDAFRELIKAKKQVSTIDAGWDACEIAAKFSELVSCESSKDLIDAPAYARTLKDYVSAADNFIGQVS